MRDLRPIALAALLAAGLAACKDDQTLTTYDEGDVSTVAATPAPTSPHGDMQMPPVPPEAARMNQPVTTTTPPADRASLPEGAELRDVTIAEVTFPVPTAWGQTPADQIQSSMRAAEFTIPAPEGEDRGGELVVFYFGEGGAGGVAANIQRWIGQMDLAPGSNPPVYASEANGLTITEVYCEGTLRPSMMGSGPSEPMSGSALYGLIIEGGPAGPLFLKATGSSSALEAAKPAFATIAGKVKAGG